MSLRLFVYFWVYLAASSVAQADALPLFEVSEPLEAVLSAPLTQIYREKGLEERLYYPGHWSYNASDGTQHRLDLKVRTRGNFRRQYCRLPPLQLNFRKSTVKGTLFHRQDKLKLVGPCNISKKNEQLVALEYLVYRMFSVVADDFHFKTRLIKLSYVDTDHNRKPWTDMTFVIEDEKDVGKRLKRKVHKKPIDADQLDPQRAAIVELFQYMIGNTDFSTIRSIQGRSCCHNIKLFNKKDEPDGFIPIPYDFDSSGFVDAPYAGPSEKLEIDDVRQRLFMGRCRSDDSLQFAITRFRERHEDILDVVRLSSEIDERQRKSALRYLDGFYKILDSEKRTQAKLFDKCI